MQRKDEEGASPILSVGNWFFFPRILFHHALGRKKVLRGKTTKGGGESDGDLVGRKKHWVAWIFPTRTFYIPWASSKGKKKGGGGNLTAETGREASKRNSTNIQSLWGKKAGGGG